MANVSITKWEIAEMFGLKFHDQVETQDYSEGDYQFSINGKAFTEQWMYEDTCQEREDSAKERAAERVC